MKTTIRKKLLVSIISLLTMLYLITCVAASIFVRGLLVDQADRDNRQVLVQATQQMDIILQMCDMTARQVMTDEDLDGVAQAAHSGPPEQKYVIISRANTVLTRYIALNPFVANIAVLTPDGMTLSNQGVLVSDMFQSRAQAEWFRAFTQSNARMLVSDVVSTRASNQNEEVVILVYKFRMLSQEKGSDSYLMLDIPTEQFRSLLQSEGAYTDILVVNDAGQAVVASDVLAVDDLAGLKNRNGVYSLPKSIALYERMDSVGWNLYYPIPRSDFNRPITLLLAGFVGLYLLALLVVIALLSRRIGSIVAPVHSITTTMQAAYKGNLDVHTDVHSGDELEILSDCFNKLVDDLQKHIGQIIEDENTKKQMQIDLLISQIHPHFIYNTLNSAVYLIEEKNDETAIETIYSLIHILQNVVRIGSKEIFATVGEEIELVQSYTAIAAVRYPGMFTVEVDCEEGMLGESIPKVLIQPLVENAITHGVLPGGRPGSIHVAITCQRPGWLDICVEDDGVGLDEARLEAVLAGRLANSAHGVGLANIRNRIQFLYNAAGHTFSVEARHPQGTRVFICLPLDSVQSDTPQAPTTPASLGQPPSADTLGATHS